MTAKEFEFDRDLPLLVRLGAKLDRRPDRGVVERLGRYVELVARWNRTINLTGAREAAALVEVLLADAFVLADRALIPPGARLVDVGSGAGAPALPLVVMRDDLRGVLIEPRRKPVAFLRTVVGTLGLMGMIQVRETRVAPDDPEVEGQPFDVAISRAAFAPEVWVAVGARLARRTLVLTAAAEPPPPPVGVERGESREYRLPGSGAPRRVTVYLSSSCG